MTTYKGKPVTVWADGFGTWYARVDLPDTGYGNTGALSIDRNWDSIRAAARRAIRSEVIEREQTRTETRAQTSARLAPTRIEVEAHGIWASSNIWHSVTFKETA